MLTDNLGRLLGLEGCLSGNKPKDQPAPGGRESPCAEFARTKPVKVVYGPGTFINSAVGEINDQFQRSSAARQQEAERAKRAARKLAAAQGRDKARQEKAADAAEQLVYAQFTRDLLDAQPALRARAQGAAADRRPRLRLRARVRPAARRDDAEGALRLPVPELALGGHPGAAEARPHRGAAAARDRARARRGGDEGVAAQERRGYTVTGAPVVVEDLAAALTDSLLRLLVVALLVMAIVLALVFRSRLRLLPLAVALAAVAITFGLMSLLGASLTMASIAVLPVLLGLGVDYAIQYQARVEEEERRPDAEAAAHTARIAVPTIATAGLATGVGFLVLLLSPVPMVRGFGCCSWPASRSRSSSRSAPAPRRWSATARRRGGGGRLGASARGAARAGRRAGRARRARRCAAAAARRPRARARRCAARSSARGGCC